MSENDKKPKDEDIDDIDKNIFLFNDVKEETSESFCSQLLKLSEKILKQKRELESELQNQDISEDWQNEIYKKIEETCRINFYINTDGGIIREMAAMIDCIEFIKSLGLVVSTIGVGKIYSAGLGLLCCGTLGYRKVGKNARLMFHDISDTVSGSFRTIKAEIKESEKERDFYISILSKYTGQTKKFFQDMLKRDSGIDHYFSPEQALEWGIVDSILEYDRK